MPGKGGGVVSYFRSKSTEPLSHATGVQDALFEHIVSQIRSMDWFVTSDLEDTYFPSPSFPITGSSLRCAMGAKYINIGFFPSAFHSHPALSQSVWILRWFLCDSRASAYSTTSMVVDISLSEWMVGFGIEMSFLLTRKSWGSDLTPEKYTENHLSGRGVGFDDDAGT